jgi:hypothetical protein
MPAYRPDVHSPNPTLWSWSPAMVDTVRRMNERQLQDGVTTEENRQRFVRRVVDGGQVWGLKGADGWAICDSVESEEARVMPFWSDRAYAARAARAEWAAFTPTAIPLAVFIDTWLAGMQKDGVLVGPNWDANDCGVELLADALAEELEVALTRRFAH